MGTKQQCAAGFFALVSGREAVDVTAGLAAALKSWNSTGAISAL